MKGLLLTTAFFLAFTLNAQWTDNGSNITTTDRVGIGTISPSSELEVKSAAGNDAKVHINTESDGEQSIIRFQDAGQTTWGFLSNYPGAGKFSLYNYQNNTNSIVIGTNDNVGIGTSSPMYRLDVNGPIRTKGFAVINGADLRLGGDDGRDIGTKVDQRALVHYTNDRLYINFGGDFEGGVRYQGPKHIFEGSIGLGANDPGEYKLAVKGKIRAEEIKVETGWADHVFDEEYNLPTLEEVESHIKEKGHLINIPSAKEVEENGIELGEMNKLLLEKIEELTLYTIQQQKTIQELRMKCMELKHIKKDLDEMKKVLLK